jgi:hypothetical protein
VPEEAGWVAGVVLLGAAPNKPPNAGLAWFLSPGAAPKGEGCCVFPRNRPLPGRVASVGGAPAGVVEFIANRGLAGVVAAVGVLALVAPNKDPVLAAGL